MYRFSIFLYKRSYLCIDFLFLFTYETAELKGVANKEGFGV